MGHGHNLMHVLSAIASLMGCYGVKKWCILMHHYRKEIEESANKISSKAASAAATAASSMIARTTSTVVGKTFS